MATLTFDGIDDRININPLSTSLNNIPNGATTIALLLAKSTAANNDDVCGLRGGNMSGGYYHGLIFGDEASYHMYDDDGSTIVSINTTIANAEGVAANDFFIAVLDWPSGAAATERGHWSTNMGSAESWTHTNSSGNNGGNTAGPGTGTGYFHIGDYDGRPFGGAIALIGVWAGTRFSDANVLDLWVNKKTSDWYNHPAGTPDTLIELTSTSPTDIGGDPVSSIVVTGATATGANPTGWDFDGQGGAPPTEKQSFYAFRRRSVTR